MVRYGSWIFSIGSSAPFVAMRGLVRPPFHVSGCHTRLPHRTRQPHPAAFPCVRQTRVENACWNWYSFQRYNSYCWNNNNSDVTREFPCGKRMRQPQKSNTAGSLNAGAFVARVCRVCRTHRKNSVHSSNLEKRCDNRMQQPDTWNGSLRPQFHVSGCHTRLPHRTRQPHPAAFPCVRQTRAANTCWNWDPFQRYNIYCGFS